jgi:hypothetical protein
MRQREWPVERWQYLVQVGLWPKKSIFDPSGWMSNFAPDEEKFALRLLEGFTYFSPELMAQMFHSAFLSLSQIVIARKDQYREAQQQWQDFVSSVLIVRVTGETPNDSDSGYAYARLARTKLGIPEDRIVRHDEALMLITHNSPPCNVVFVDDFVGSGNQFVETWRRIYDVAGYDISFDIASKLEGNGSRFFYCPVICTETGKKNIADYCPDVKIISAHFFDSRHSVLANDSAIWREDMSVRGPEFVRVVSTRIGLPDLDGQVGCWRGFHKLGLALGFNEHAPDSTLPIFTTNINGWKPLIRT